MVDMINRVKVRQRKPYLWLFVESKLNFSKEKACWSLLSTAMSFLESPYYVTTSEAAAALAAVVDRAQLVAVDTEADSLHHYFEKVCLLQISVCDQHYVVDPLAQADLRSLLSALGEKTLIFHGADYDLRMLRRSFDFRPRAVFDTMIAAQLLGYPQIGLAALVEKHFNVILCKKGQKSDWSRRPLSDEMLEYAVNDTRFLSPLTEIFAKELQEKGRLDWHTEMCISAIEAVNDSPVSSRDPEREWRIRGWQALPGARAHAVLREIWHWRDKEARHCDLPSFKILPNEAVIEIARWAAENNPSDPIPRLPRNCVGKRLAGLKHAISNATKLPESELPKPLISARRRVLPANDKLLTALRKVRDEKARALSIEPAMLAPAAAVAAVARELPDTCDALQAVGDLHHWQAELLEGDFLAMIEEFKRGRNGHVREVIPPADPSESSPAKSESRSR
jgi:ribonuclease D